MATHRCKHICNRYKPIRRPKFAKELTPLPPEKNYFLKFPSKIFKTATAQPTHKDQNTNLTMTAQPLSDLTFTTRQTERQQVTAVLQKWRFSASYDSFVVGSSAVLRLNLALARYL
ncbi:MAG: hypothetical protein HUU47_01835 [Bacteroidetes bacterium]|nr:hypothetical protein [Bacteroidota bacterium]